ncbi:hypothetical protein D4R89_08740 [bacterium]|nr:MAG: hypothetical protein D4R89_08740 [bacterium]
MFLMRRAFLRFSQSPLVKSTEKMTYLAFRTQVGLSSKIELLEISFRIPRGLGEGLDFRPVSAAH